MNITPHFSWSEFKCHDGTPVPDHLTKNVVKLCTGLEIIRSMFDDRPIRIISGYRHRAYNTRVGGARYSRHLTGMAADIQIDDVSHDAMYCTILGMMHDNRIPKGGLGLYQSWVHYDVRGEIVPWIG